MASEKDPQNYSADSAPPQKSAKIAACHPDRKHYAKGLCITCYQNTRNKSMRGGASDVKNVMVEGAGYKGVPPSQIDISKEPNPIKYKDPDVAKYFVAVLIRNQMDYRATVLELAPEVSPAKRGAITEEMVNAPEIQKELEKVFASLGLDENSKTAFVRKMWMWLYGSNQDLAIKAATVLGKGFIGDKVEVNKPQELPIKDFQKGVNRMLGQDGADENAIAPAVAEEINELKVN